MIEVREVLRAWLEGAGLRAVAERAGGVDRKTDPRYVQAAQEAGPERSAGWAAVDDALVGAVVAAVRPGTTAGTAPPWEMLLAHEEQVRAWVAGDGKDVRPLSIVKIEELFARQGVVVPYRTLHRFATERCGYRTKETTVRGPHRRGPLGRAGGMLRDMSADSEEWSHGNRTRRLGIFRAWSPWADGC